MKKVRMKDICLLQIAVIIYTFSSVAAKIASTQTIGKFLLLYCVEVMILGIYALLWQQIIKRVDLSAAYANRAMSVIWSMIWAVVFFGSSLTVNNVVGVCLVLTGVMIINHETISKEA